jgi:Uri superfamily endonuclease
VWATDFTVFGTRSQAGTYLLRIGVHERVLVRFGRFRGGKSISMPAGDYLYVGSAMGPKGASSLARRLLRHATRTGVRRPHAIRAQMLAFFPAIGLGVPHLHPPAGKTLYWHIDYLLEEPVAELKHVFMWRQSRPLERALAEWLENEPETAVLATGLGARDMPGQTHILAVSAHPDWWQTLPERLNAHLGIELVADRRPLTADAVSVVGDQPLAVYPVGKR